ncbi:MAG: phosphate regulon sensor histidine kinase PhoR [Xanthomonadales bacterium]|nr:phosphate regulon sensor histidine kinase PhoR [Xanthomonadales bacterium]
MAARSWKFHAGRLLLMVPGILLVGWLAGYPLEVLAMSLLAYLAWHLANLWRLYRWLQMPGSEVPESYGIWSDVYERIASLEKDNQKQKDQYRGMLAEFRQLTDAFPDATLVMDAQRNITWFNQAAQALLGLRSPQDLGKPVTNLLRGPDFANWLAVQGQVKSPLEMPSPRDDNVWLTISAFAFQKDQRLIILRDNTEVHNVERIRRDFVANISHELRTPLTVLQGYLEMLQDNESPEVSDSVARMLSQTAQMQMLLYDLLELSRLQSDEIRGEEEVIDVPGMLMQLQEQADELSRGRHQLVFEVDSGPWLSGVATDLESAFGNLLSNAIKYTPDGGTIKVSWREAGPGPQLVVEDTGIGIPKRDIPRLTERFYRVGSDRARQTGGTGLGLSIVKHVLNAHQATLTIESEIGEGSRFTCTFPPERRLDESA